MENASKALIIAGAILLSILLISLGIYIFTQAQTVVNGSGMTQAEVSSFNNQFLKYEKTIKGSEVKSLIQEVNINNSQDDSKEKTITLILPGATTGGTTGGTTGETTATTYKTSGIVNTRSYKVEVTGYGPDGRITAMTISNADNNNN